MVLRNWKQRSKPSDGPKINMLSDFADCSAGEGNEEHSGPLIGRGLRVQGDQRS